MRLKEAQPSHHCRIAKNVPPLPLRLLLGLLHDLLDNLLLLDQEGAGDTVLDAIGAARAAVGTLDGLLGPRDGRVFAWAEGRDLLRYTCQFRS